MAHSRPRLTQGQIQLMAKCGSLPSLFVNKVLLKCSPIHLLTSCLWLLSCLKWQNWIVATATVWFSKPEIFPGSLQLYYYTLTQSEGQSNKSFGDTSRTNLALVGVGGQEKFRTKCLVVILGLNLGILCCALFLGELMLYSGTHQAGCWRSAVSKGRLDSPHTCFSWQLDGGEYERGWTNVMGLYCGCSSGKHWVWWAPSYMKKP